MILHKKFLIIGNSGSGKTWTGKNLSKLCNIPIFHMDQIWWEPGKFTHIRFIKNMENDIKNIVQKDEWILEGVFGILAEKAAPFATHLLWLDLTWKECETNLVSRGPQLPNDSTTDEKEIALSNLIKWAATHYSREDENSEKFFKEIFNKFSKAKIRLHNRIQVEDYLKSLN